MSKSRSDSISNTVWAIHRHDRSIFWYSHSGNHRNDHCANYSPAYSFSRHPHRHCIKTGRVFKLNPPVRRSNVFLYQCNPKSTGENRAPFCRLLARFWAMHTIRDSAVINNIGFYHRFHIIHS